MKRHIYILCLCLLCFTACQKKMVCHEIFIHNTLSEPIIVEGITTANIAIPAAKVDPDSCTFIYEWRTDSTSLSQLLQEIRIYSLNHELLYSQEPIDNLLWTQHDYYLLVNMQRQLKYISFIFTIEEDTHNQ